MKTLARICLFMWVLFAVAALCSAGILLAEDYIRLRQRVTAIEEVLSEPIEVIIPLNDTIVIPPCSDLEVSYE